MANKYAARKMFDEGVAAYIKKDFKKSVDLLSRAIKYDPSLALFYVSRGVARLKQEKAREAISDFNRAIELDEGYGGWPMKNWANLPGPLKILIGLSR